MKQLLILTLVASATLFYSCSKKSAVKPNTTTTTTTQNISSLSSTTFAGGGLEASTDGTGTNAEFYEILKLTSDGAGNIYVLEAVNLSTNLSFKIRKVTPDGTTTTLFNGGSETFVNNLPVTKTKIYRLIDIASDPNGNIYVQANMTDYSTISNTQQTYYQELGLYKVNTATSSLDPILVSSTTTSQAEISWAAPYNVLNNISVDASGNVYGDYITGNSIPGTGNIYKINATGGTLLSSVSNLFPESIYSASNGNVSVIATTAVVNIAGVQSSAALYTFPVPVTASPEILFGDQSGILYGYGNLYDSSKTLKGTGFYKLAANGTVTNEGILSSASVIFTATADESSDIYFAVHSGAGYTIQKVSLK